MATRVTKKSAFLAQLRSGGSDSPTSPRRVVNAKLEMMLDKMMQDAADGKLEFEQQMAVGALALKLEAVRNRMQDDDYGTGFGDEAGRVLPDEEGNPGE
jgi:hypothetical protein